MCLPKSLLKIRLCYFIFRIGGRSCFLKGVFLRAFLKLLIVFLEMRFPKVCLSYLIFRIGEVVFSERRFLKVRLYYGIFRIGDIAVF